jgi:hypothetical protein
MGWNKFVQKKSEGNNIPENTDRGEGLTASLPMTIEQICIGRIASYRASEVDETETKHGSNPEALSLRKV